MTSPLWTSDALLDGTGGTLFDHAHPLAPVHGIAIDSRDCSAGDLFVALGGERQDGHEFIQQAVTAGAAACLVSRPDKNLPIAQIVVDDPLAGLTRLAKSSRGRFTGKMVGITGSVGKTGSKDMLAHALAGIGTTHASTRSFNNHIGVPVSLASLPANDDFAVQEMGMNAAGEIAVLSDLARPDVALITRIANTHGGFFATLDDIAAAKAEIFNGLGNGGIAVLNRDDQYYHYLCAAALQAGAAQIISFGQHDAAEFALIEARQQANGTFIRARINGEELTFTIAMHGAHWALNALGVLASIAALGLPVNDAAASLATCPTPQGRGGRIAGIYQGSAVTLIDDSYNASPASMAAAFTSMSHTPPHIMVLSEMLELGDGTHDAHAALPAQINALKPRLVIALGGAMHDILPALDHPIASFAANNTAAAMAAIDNAITSGDRIFIKGSLGSGSWRVRDAILAGFTPQTTSKNGGSCHAA